MTLHIHTSIPTLDVLPVSISCLWRNRPMRARPLPSSSPPTMRKLWEIYIARSRPYLASKLRELSIFHYPHSLRQQPLLQPPWIPLEEVIVTITLLSTLDQNKSTTLIPVEYKNSAKEAPASYWMAHLPADIFD